MKKSMKVVSLALAFALTVTSVPNEWTTRVARVQAAESGDSQMQMKQALMWNAEDESVDATKLNEGKDVYATAVKYGEEPGEFEYEGTLDTGVSPYGSNTSVMLDESAVREALDLTEDVTVSVDEIGYQWYVVDAKGNKTKLEEEDGSQLSFWYTEDDMKVNNGTGDKTFVCELTVTSLEDSDWNYYDTEELAQEYNWTIERKFTLKYAGKTASKSDLDTYFSGADKIKDETFVEHNSSDVTSFSRLMEVDELGIKDYSAGRYNYTWVTYFTDGTKKEEKKSENNSYLYDLEKTGYMYDTFYDEKTDEEEEKQVDYYECKIELCYGYQVIDTVSKKFYFRYSPIDFEDSQGMDVLTTIRGNGTAYMDATAEIYDTGAVEPDSVTYQWYRIGADGKEVRLDGEITPTYTVRVPDAGVSYKVVVSVEKEEGYTGPEFSDLVRTYRFQSSGGYLLKDRSESSYEINIGDTQELYVKARVDDAYDLKYKWERISYVDEEKEDGQIEKKVVKEKVGAESKYEVKPKKLSDFENVSGCKETDWNDCNYAVTVSVMKGEKEVETYTYYFSVREDISYEVLESSPSKQVIDLGDDLNLFVKTNVKDCYRLEQNWYKKLDEEKVKRTYDFTIGDYVYEPVDPEFALTESADIEKVSTVGEYEDGSYVYTRTYYKKVGQGAEYSRKGIDNAGKPVDVRGDYMCRLEMFRVEEPDADKDGADGKGGKAEKAEPLTGTSDMDFTVTYDSDLSAYAKNDWLAVKEGEKARFRIVAQTKNNDIYKIQYLWEKWDETASRYVKVKNEAGEEVTTAIYEIAQTSRKDAGRYRVTVSDSTGETLSPIYLTLSVEESGVQDADVETSVTEVTFTPEYSYYDLDLGQTVDLNVDMKLSEDVDVFYAWYRNEKVEKREGENASYEYNWELLGQDTNTYKLAVQNEDDFTTYKCVAIYRKKNTEYARKEFRFVVRQAYSAYLEKMTPGTQIKRVGDSATYSVRLITDDPNMEARYQWYRDGEKIAGANDTTYRVEKLEKKDFGIISCEVTDAKSGEKIAASTSFRTRVYLNGAYLDTNNDVVETELNAPETILGPPVVVKGEGLALTYQWYRTNDEEEDDYETIIYGATESAYAIDEFGRNDFRTYACRVYADGYYLDTYYTTAKEKGEEQPGEEVAPISIEIREGYEKDVEAFLGKSAAFAVTAKSNRNLALKYQWYYGEDEEDGEAIGGATSSEYVIDVVTPSRKGSYFCVVTDEKGNRIRSEIFTLTTTTGLNVDNEGLNWSDAVGVQTTFGAQNVTLTATATASEENGYTPFFQWYHNSKDDKGLIYGATSKELVIPSIDEDALGMYYCVVGDNSGAEVKTLSYYVYVNTGLNVMPSTYYVLSKDDGTASMYVTATADAGYDITYEWSKYDEDDEEYTDHFVPIEGAVGAAYTISPLKRADYGIYRCIIRTRGERNVYEFMIEPSYSVDSNRTFAFQGDEVTVSSAIENPAADLTYEYQWYEKEPATGTFRKISGATSNSCTKVVPKLNLSEQFTNNDKLGYVPVSYKCIITITGVNKDGSEYEETMNYNTSVRVLPDINYSEDRLPETNHPNDKAFDIQAYRAPGAERLRLDFSGQTDLGSADLYIIARDGTYWTTANVDRNGSRWQSPESVTVQGDSVVLLMNGNSKASSYGYQVSHIEKMVTPQPGTELKPGEQQPGAAAQQPNAAAAPVSAAAAAGGSKAVKKGAKYTIKGLKYKVTSASAKKRTVTVIGAKSKKTASVNIPATVKISGKKYKVTSIAAKAFQGYAKLKSATIGANVKSIGANAFAKDKKLTKLTIKGKVLKSAGKGAFNGVPKKAKAAVPKKSKKAYKKVLKKGGFKGKVK